eukprot:TRINITY_DN90525_c0_g1_i1.p1 TRINITY_DN90525_c0_g1~~TRINITY_DN90525_c0_g1_i1.p1  ORF type:complete len:445 (+),score=96.98 TRINITY_DN90525_c0_g1_i1:121-1455(+)
MAMMLNFSDILYGGEVGRLRGDSEQFGWKPAAGGDPVLWQMSSVKQAEWFEGQVKILMEHEDGQSEVIGLGGFKPTDYDKLWKHFNAIGVYIKKRERAAQTSKIEFDGVLSLIETAADEVDEAPPSSVIKKAKEADLMKHVEAVRDGLDKVIGGDKQALSNVFAANGCERIGRLRLVISTVQVEMFKADPRWRHLRNQTRSIEGVLKSLGTFRAWKPEEGVSESLSKRQVVRELRRKQGLAEDSEEDNMPAPRPVAAGGAVADLTNKLAATNLIGGGYGNPLAGGPPAAKPAEPVQSAEPEPMAEPETQPPVPAPQPVQEPERSPPPRERKPADTLGDTPAPRNQENIIEGWVYKRSRHLKQWRRRWLVLTPRYLATFENDSIEGKPTEMLEMGTVTSVRDGDSEAGQSGAIAITSAGRTYCMIPDLKTEKAEWMRKMQSTLLK